MCPRRYEYNLPERNLGKKEKVEELLNLGKRNPAVLIRNLSTRGRLMDCLSMNRINVCGKHTKAITGLFICLILSAGIFFRFYNLDKKFSGVMRL